MRVPLSPSMSMASSNNSNSENKKFKNGESSTTATKTKKKRDSDNNDKENNKKKKKKNNKLQLSNGNDVEEVEDAKTHVFPMQRIRTMLKNEIPDIRVSTEAILAINKAAEKFIEQLTQDAHACCAQDRKKFLSYNHLSHVVNKQRRYDFLSDFVPEKVKAEDALRERNLRGNGGG